MIAGSRVDISHQPRRSSNMSAHEEQGGLCRLSSAETWSALRQIQESGAYSDFEIKCQHRVFKAHKAIVCPRSGFFEAAFRVGMQEEAEGVVDLSHFEPEVVDAMLQYIYTTTYPHIPRPKQAASPNSSEKTERIAPKRSRKGRIKITKPPNFLHHVKVYALADMLLMPALKHRASHNFESECALGWDDPEFIDAVSLIYTEGIIPEEDRRLKDIVIVQIRNNVKLAAKEEIRKLIESKPKIAVDLVNVLITAHNDGYADFLF